MRQLLVFALSRLKQLKVTEADDGVDGLRKLAAGKFDIILTDINMPIMDGLKLVKRVRTDAVHKDVPIVVITTESAEEDRQRALALGASAAGIARPMLKALGAGGRAGALSFLDGVVAELRAIMLLTASKDLAALRKAPRLLGAELRSWLDAR